MPQLSPTAPQLDAYARASCSGRPDEAAITLLIAELDLTLPDVLAETEDASHEITRFDAELGAELGDEIAPFAAVLLRSESAASSRIEKPDRLGQVTVPPPAGC